MTDKRATKKQKCELSYNRKLKTRCNEKMTFSNFHYIKAFVFHLKDTPYKVLSCFDFKGYNPTKLRKKFYGCLTKHLANPNAYAEYDRLLREGMPDFQNLWGSESTLGFYVDWKVFEEIKINFLNKNLFVDNSSIRAAIINVLSNLSGENLTAALSRGLIDCDKTCLKTYNTIQCDRFLSRHHIVDRQYVNYDENEGVFISLTLEGQRIGNDVSIIGVCKLPQSRHLVQSAASTYATYVFEEQNTDTEARETDDEFHTLVHKYFG
jgi:hypothetical protein